MKINKFTLVILLTLSTQSTAWADNINHGLDEYGKKYQLLRKREQ